MDVVYKNRIRKDCEIDVGIVCFLFSSFTYFDVKLCSRNFLKGHSL